MYCAASYGKECYTVREYARISLVIFEYFSGVFFIIHAKMAVACQNNPLLVKMHNIKKNGSISRLRIRNLGYKIDILLPDMDLAR